ncbi:alpha/beta hydrolase [Streptacidiphilus griseoplanus]|uniref:alpha/beta hydrolase n=1 Tax=Peterkaempfera griseoplana TaxID=66896 RepID=UPI0006E31225|nr:alpha/beta hydrolase [Peterkaempfera griseoplana]
MPRLKRALIAVLLTAAAVTGTAGWATASGQVPVTGPPPGTAGWLADTVQGRRPPDPATASPRQIGDYFATLTATQAAALAARHPLVVGNLDGAPIALRYRANTLALRSERRRELTRAADPALTPQDHAEALRRADRYAALLRPGRQILAFDPRGRGQIAEVYGDLTAARRVAVVVPGSDIDLGSFDRDRDPYGTPAGMARSLLDRMRRQQPDTPAATVAWVGYTTPVGLGIDAATSRLARAGAPRLVRFLAGLAGTGRPAAPPAVLCHSYGSVVCGIAASSVSTAEASDLVVLGSPGMHSDDAAGLRTRVRVWAARDGSDWIRRVPHLSLAGLGHGADPVDPRFGARVVSAARAHGHTGYLAPGTDSLANAADIALGDYPAVHCATDDQECRHGL